MTVKTRNPYLGMHPDLFPPEEQYPTKLEEKPSKLPKMARVLLQEAKKHESPEIRRQAEQTALRKQAKKEHPERVRELFGIMGSRRAATLSEREAEILAAAHRGETPVFVELESLTTDQIRELPRRSFTEEEWDRLDEDDQEYIIENDTESQARVDELAELFIDRWKSEKENAGDNDSVSEYFHDWLGNRRRIWDLMPDHVYEHLVEYGEERGIDVNEVREFISEYLGDPSNYSLDTDSGDSVWEWEVEGQVYLDGEEIAPLFNVLTDDEKERAVEKVSEETERDITPGVDELDRATTKRRGYYSEYSETFQTGVTIYANIDWDNTREAIEETIRDRAPEPQEDEDDDEGIDLDKIEITGKVPKLPRPAQPVVYEWPDGTTMVDMKADDDELVGIAEALGILGIPWTTESKNKDSLKPRIAKEEIRYHGKDEDGMPTFRRGELAFGLESLEMRHCVGWANMGYMDGVRRGEIKILSMRHADPKKRPMFTIEASIAGRSMLGPIESRKITSIQQIKGFSNSVAGFDRGEHTLVDSQGKIDKLTGREIEEIEKKFKRDEVQKIIEWVLSVGVDPHSVHDPSYGGHDLWPALNVIQLMADREDPWAMELQAKIDRIRHASTEDVMSEEPSDHRAWSVRTEGRWRQYFADSDMHAREQHHEEHPDEDIIEVIRGAPTPVTWIITGEGVPGGSVDRVAVTEREAREIAQSNFPYVQLSVRRANPAPSYCEHGVCEGFCRPYRPRPTTNPEGDARYWVVGFSPPARPGIAKFTDALKIARQHAREANEPVDIVWGVVSYAPLEGAKTDIFGRTIVEPTAAHRRAKRSARLPRWRRARRPQNRVPEPAIPLHVVATVLPDGELIVHSPEDVPARYAEGLPAVKPPRTRSEAGKLGAVRVKRRKKIADTRRAVAAALDISQQLEETSSARAFVDAVIEAEAAWETSGYRAMRPEAVTPTEFRERVRHVAGQISTLRSSPLRWEWRQVYDDGYVNVRTFIHEVPQTSSDQPRITISYDVYSSSGGPLERGWDNEDGAVIVDDGTGIPQAAVSFLRRQGASATTAYDTAYTDSEEIAQGTQRRVRTFHLMGFTADQEREIRRLFEQRLGTPRGSTGRVIDESVPDVLAIAASLRIRHPISDDARQFIEDVQSSMEPAPDLSLDQRILRAAERIGEFHDELPSYWSWRTTGVDEAWHDVRIPALRARAMAPITEALSRFRSAQEGAGQSSAIDEIRLYVATALGVNYDAATAPAGVIQFLDAIIHMINIRVERRAPRRGEKGWWVLSPSGALDEIWSNSENLGWYADRDYAYEVDEEGMLPVTIVFASGAGWWDGLADLRRIANQSQRQFDAHVRRAAAEIDPVDVPPIFRAGLPFWAMGDPMPSPEPPSPREVTDIERQRGYDIFGHAIVGAPSLHRQGLEILRARAAAAAEASTSPTTGGVDGIPDPWFDNRFRLAVAVALDVRDRSQSLDEGESNAFVTLVMNSDGATGLRQMWEAIEYLGLTGADPRLSIEEFTRRVLGAALEVSEYDDGGWHHLGFIRSNAGIVFTNEGNPEILPSVAVSAFRSISAVELRIARVLGIDVPIRPYIPGGTVMTGPLRNVLDFLFSVFEYMQANYRPRVEGSTTWEQEGLPVITQAQANVRQTMSGFAAWLESLPDRELGGMARRAADIMTGSSGPPWWFSGFRIVSQLPDADLPSAREAPPPPPPPPQWLGLAHHPHGTGGMRIPLLPGERLVASDLGIDPEEPGARGFIQIVVETMSGLVIESFATRHDVNRTIEDMDTAERLARVRDAANSVAERVGSRGWRFRGELIQSTALPSVMRPEARTPEAPQQEADPLYAAIISALAPADNLDDDTFQRLMSFVQRIAQGRQTEGSSYGDIAAGIPGLLFTGEAGTIMAQVSRLMTEAAVIDMGESGPRYRSLMGRIADHADRKLRTRIPRKDMSQVIGQPEAVAAVERAVATHQNILLTPPRSSTTYLIERIPTIMQPVGGSPAPLVVVSHDIVPPAIGGGGDRERRREAIEHGIAQLLNKAEDAAGGVLFLEDIAEFNTDGLRALKAKLLEMTYRPLIVGTFKDDDAKARIDLIGEILGFPIRATMLSHTEAIGGKNADSSAVIRDRIAASAAPDDLSSARYRAMEMEERPYERQLAERFLASLSVGDRVILKKDVYRSRAHGPGPLPLVAPAGSTGTITYKDVSGLAVTLDRHIDRWLDQDEQGRAKVYWEVSNDDMPHQDLDFAGTQRELEIETPEESTRKSRRAFRARLKDGERIRFVRDVYSPYPTFTVPRGTLATLTYVSRDRICAMMDDQIPGAESLGNEFCWDGPDLTLSRDFEIYEEESMPMIELNPQDNPGWVTNLLAKHLEFLEENVPARWLPKLTAVSRGRGAERITAAMKEYGCGAYGCVLPTLDPKVVLKVTTDDTEYAFAKNIAHKLSVQVTVEYHLVIDAPETYKGRNVYMLWRDSAERVGQIDKSSKTRASTVEKAVDVQHKAAQQAYVALHSGVPAQESINAWVEACRDMGKIVPELHALSLGMIKNLQKNKVFMGDVHAGNIGLVGKRWLVIDPGNIAVLKK